MSESSVITRMISAVKDTMVETAESAMLQPFDANRMAVTVGRYQGLKSSLDILDSILRDTEEKERS